MIRSDVIGATHENVPTPHVHIFDAAHNNGRVAVPLSDFLNYSPTTDIKESLAEFLKYNNFDISGISITEPIV